MPLLWIALYRFFKKKYAPTLSNLDAKSILVAIITGIFIGSKYAVKSLFKIVKAFWKGLVGIVEASKPNDD